MSGKREFTPREFAPHVSTLVLFLYLENRGTSFLLNVSNDLSDYTVSHARRY
jgi:hypothetical protein